MNTEAVRVESIESQVQAWRRANFESPTNHGEQAICCVPFHCTQRVCDCAKRKQGEVHYKTVKVDGQTFRTPKPKYVNCVKCVVWEYLDACEENNE